MKDYKKLLFGTFAGEQIDNEPVLSIEEELAQDIALESEYCDAIDASFTAAMESIVAGAECVAFQFAERELGLPCNSGIAVESVYADFELGTEAITDVVKRKAYAGVANIKALIASVISWIKNIIGLGVSSKKIYKSLEKKAKAAKKALQKYAGSQKIGAIEDKELVNYTSTASNASYVKSGEITYDEHSKVQSLINDICEATDKAAKTTQPEASTNPVTGFGSESEGTNDVSNAIKSRIDTIATQLNQLIKENKTALENAKENKNEWKEDTVTKSGKEVYNHIFNGLNKLQENSSNFKSTDIQKGYDKAVKELENTRKGLDKKYTSNEMINLVSPLYTKAVTVVGGIFNLQKHNLKIQVAIADQMLTDAKWLQMKLA